MTLSNLTLTPADRSAEFRRRQRSYDEQTVTPGAVSDYTPLGWSVAKTREKSVTLRKPRETDVILENRFWCVLYRLGYPELNVGRNFQISVTSGTPPVMKQVDVFAKDPETIVIAECKTADAYKKKSIQKDLGEFHANKKLMADSVRNHYGKSYKPKIIWAFVVCNMSLTESDYERAKEYRISIITDRELDYVSAQPGARTDWPDIVMRTA